MTGTEIYNRTPTYEREAESIRLHAPQWKLLLAFDGQRTLAEVALSIDTAFSDALPLTEKFLGSQWIEEQPITLSQYLKRTGAVDASAGSAVTPAVVLHGAKTEASAPAPQLASAVMEEAVPAFRGTPPPTNSAPSPAPAKENSENDKPAGGTPLFGNRGLTPPPVSAPPFVPNQAKVPPLRTIPSALHPPPTANPAPVTPPPVPTPPPIVNPPAALTPPPISAAPAAVATAAATAVATAPASIAVKTGMKIKAVVDYIVSQVGNNSLGQLVVYRVFLRVPPQLLQDEDIASVHLVNDQSVVKTDALKQAIASSVLEVLKRALPESILAS